MTMPMPQNLEGVPLWENYVVAQTTQASLSLIPREALALGVEVDDLHITVVCQVRVETEATTEDLNEITQELYFLIGESAQITTRLEKREAPTITPDDEAIWIFASRDDNA